jgi:hypothetical protein
MLQPMLYFVQFLLIFYSLPLFFSLNTPQPYFIHKFVIQADTVFTGPKRIGELENAKIDEPSGLAFSHVHSGIFYTHNDSGGKALLYLTDTLGKHKGLIKLKEVWNRDWEDIAVGPGPEEGVSYVYVGEIGDNSQKYKSIRLYRFPEPEVLHDSLEVFPEMVKLTYPDGAKDAETLLLDPITKDVFILTKRDSVNGLYRVPQEAWGQEKFEMEKVMDLPIAMAVGGDISKDGKAILIKNYFVVYYWERYPEENIMDALARNPTILPYKPEPQGEAIGFTPSGNSYFTLSEKRFGIAPVLYRYNKIQLD